MSKKTYRLMSALILANVLSVAAVSAAQATDGPPGGAGDKNGHSSASAAPVCDTDRCPVLAGDGGPANAGDHNGRSAALSEGAGEFRVAGGHSTSGDFGQ